jgi:glycosyltransferase involved in cell wall biosynthesis
MYPSTMSDGTRPEVTVLVPALNEQDTIQEVVDRLLALPCRTEVIVIDDGSTDDTPRILDQYRDRIRILRNETKGGKGNAIRQALPYATGRATIIQDADLEYVPEEIPTVVAPILEGRAKVVYGTRFSNGLTAGMALPNKVVNILLAWSVRLLFGKKLTDEATCYKAFETDFIKSLSLQCKRFEFCPEVTAKSLVRGVDILEVPISYIPRSKAAGKKIRWTDAPEAFWTLFKYRFQK